jgi:hypothetical protein
VLYVQTRAGAPVSEIEFDDGGFQMLTPGSGWVQGVVDGGLDFDLFGLQLNEGDTAFVSLDLSPNRDGGLTGGLPAGLLLGVPEVPTLLLVDDSNTGAATPNAEAAFVTVLDGGLFAVGVNPATASTAAAPWRLSYSIFPKSDESRCTTYTSQDLPRPSATPASASSRRRSRCPTRRRSRTSRCSSRSSTLRCPTSTCS